MSTSLSVDLYSPNPGCPPLECGLGAFIALELKSDSAEKSADGAGWLVGVIANTPVAKCQIGASDWTYVFEFEESEFSNLVIEGHLDPLEVADIAQGDGATGICCLNCGILMILDRLLQMNTRSLNRESFRIHNYNQEHVSGTQRLFRNDSAIEIYAIETSCETHLTGYPYAAEPQKVRTQLVGSPAGSPGPYSAIGTDAICEIDPASATPLTGRLEFVPPLLVAGGVGIGVSSATIDPEAHLGLEVHIEFKVVEPE